MASSTLFFLRNMKFKMRNLILQNLQIKIVVIFIAILIWFFVKTENNFQYTFQIPVTISNLDKEKIIVTPIPSHVKVTLYGQGYELLALILNQKFRYNFDLTNENESRVYKLKKENVFPRNSNIEIINIIDPDSAYIGIENLARKKVPIIPDIQVMTEIGYTIVKGIQLDSNYVSIEGAKSYLDSVFQIRTEHLIFKKVKRDLSKKAKLIDPPVKYVWLNRHDTHFMVDVQKILEKPLVEIPVQIINKPTNVELIVVPATLNLTLVGGVDILLPLTNKDIKAYIDYHKIRDSRERYYLAYIEKPELVRIKDVKPKYFRIIIKKS